MLSARETPGTRLADEDDETTPGAIRRSTAMEHEWDGTENPTPPSTCDAVGTRTTDDVGECHLTIRHTVGCARASYGGLLLFCMTFRKLININMMYFF